ncbi:NAD-dependent epimerase/dehydratase family protein [Streptomyces sp. Y1]|uniref:NAD-dependent epimerase/dehydratase family protein n=1 Tax=Streptomyces sp. Y1 TaxID=3238634 RepID=A0AB39TEH9_9ACTN
MSFHLVVGHGPAGAATARLLAERGHEVRVVTRSGGTAAPGVEHVVLDARDARALTEAARGAAAIHSCAAPPLPQWGTQWPALARSLCTAAETSGAVLVMLGNLYGYGPVTGPMTEDLPLAATGTKGRARAAAWQHALALHEAGRIRAVEVRASDFFGPGVTTGGHLAARAVPRLLGGRAVTVLGDPDAPHSWTYLPDVARALAEVASEPGAWGRAWHVPTAPARSARHMAELITTEANAEPATVRRLSPALLNAAGLFSPLLRELREVRYQFEGPFVMDCSAYEAAFTARATPVTEQITATVTWWRERLRRP